MSDDNKPHGSISGTIRPYFTVWCGRCVEFLDAGGCASTKKQAEKVFRKDGWVKTNKFGWVCPDCCKKRRVI